VAKAAATQLASLPAARRADVLDGLALILAGKKDKELARYTAGLIRLADEHQVKFFEQLTQDGSRADNGRAKTGPTILKMNNEGTKKRRGET